MNYSYTQIMKEMLSRFPGKEKEMLSFCIEDNSTRELTTEGQRMTAFDVLKQSERFARFMSIVERNGSGNNTRMKPFIQEMFNAVSTYRKHSYDLPSILLVLKTQQDNGWTNMETAEYYNLSRNTVAAWKKKYLPALHHQGHLKETRNLWSNPAEQPVMLVAGQN